MESGAIFILLAYRGRSLYNQFTSEGMVCVPEQETSLPPYSLAGHWRFHRSAAARFHASRANAARAHGRRSALPPGLHRNGAWRGRQHGRGLASALLESRGRRFRFRSLLFATSRSLPFGTSSPSSAIPTLIPPTRSRRSKEARPLPLQRRLPHRRPSQTDRGSRRARRHFSRSALRATLLRGHSRSLAAAFRLRT